MAKGINLSPPSRTAANLSRAAIAKVEKPILVPHGPLNGGERFKVSIKANIRVQIALF